MQAVNTDGPKLKLEVPLNDDVLQLIDNLAATGTLRIEGYKDPREMLTLRQAAEEGNRSYTGFYALVMKHGQDLLSRPFGETGDVRISRRNLWAFLSRHNRGGQ